MDIKAVYSKLDALVTSTPDNYVLTTKICNSINRLPLTHSNVLLGLIYEHYIITNRIKNPTELSLVSRINKKNNTLGLPYKGKTCENGKGPQFDAEKLHPKLEKIIVAYMNMISI